MAVSCPVRGARSQGGYRSPASPPVGDGHQPVYRAVYLQRLSGEARADATGGQLCLSLRAGIPVLQPSAGALVGGRCPRGSKCWSQRSRCPWAVYWRAVVDVRRRLRSHPRPRGEAQVCSVQRKGDPRHRVLSRWPALHNHGLHTRARAHGASQCVLGTHSTRLPFAARRVGPGFARQRNRHAGAPFEYGARGLAALLRSLRPPEGGHPAWSQARRA